MIDIEKIEKWAKGIDDTWLTKEEASELLHLAKEGLRFKELREAENGVANLMAVIKLGRWAKQKAIPFISYMSKERTPFHVYESKEELDPYCHYTDNAKKAVAVLDSIQESIQKQS